MASLLGSLLVGVGGAQGAGATVATQPPWGAAAAAPCDPLDASLCMAPFPDDFYTVADPALPTGRRVSIPAVPAAPPAAADFDAAPWERNDGFSPGSTILTHVPGLSLVASHVATRREHGRCTPAARSC